MTYFIFIPAMWSTLACLNFRHTQRCSSTCRNRTENTHSHSPGGRSQGAQCWRDNGSTHAVLIEREQGQGNNRPRRKRKGNQSSVLDVRIRHALRNKTFNWVECPFSDTKTCNSLQGVVAMLLCNLCDYETCSFCQQFLLQFYHLF